MKVYQNDFMIVNHLDKEKTLELIWTAETKNMVNADFKASLYIYAGFAIEFRTAQLLVHIQDFGFPDAMGEELTTWRDQQIFPKYNQAGIKKFAFLGPKEILPPTDPPQSPFANFQTRFFPSLEDVTDWFGE